MKSPIALLLVLGASTHLQAASVFLTSPTSQGELPSGPGGVSLVGGIVADLVGLNGARLVSQLSASSLFVGSSSSNPFTIGTQTGFTPALLANLGGGIAEAAFRITLSDGDTASGNFDFNQNLLRVNGQTVGNFSAVSTTNHNSNGTVVGTTQNGFANNQLGTGFFYSTNATALAGIYAGLSATGTLKFELDDVDPGDNFFDFKQGLEGNLIDAGSAPVVATIPEPTGPISTALLLASGVFMRRRRAA
jgi:hypothetical protein